MDIFVCQIDRNCKEKHLSDTLGIVLKQRGIFRHMCIKHKNKPSATLFLPTGEPTNRFIQNHCVVKGQSCPLIPLQFQGKTLRLERGRKDLNAEMNQFLQNANNYSKRRNKNQNTSQKPPEKLQRSFTADKIECGHWDFFESNLVFTPSYGHEFPGNVAFGRTSLVILFPNRNGSEGKERIDVRYSSIDSAINGTGPKSTLTLTLTQAPEITVETGEDQALLQAMLGLSISPLYQQSASDQRTCNRVSGLSHNHKLVSGTNLVYRIFLRDATAVRAIQKVLSCTARAPSLIRYATEETSTKDFSTDMMHMENDLRDQSKKKLSFSLRFQLERLATNGYLLPSKVSALAPRVTRLQDKFKVRAIESAIREVSSTLPFAGPHASPEEFDLEYILQSIEKAASKFQGKDPVISSLMNKKHLALIYQVKITPCGTYLEGPELESKNRILSQYPDHLEHFIRVTFQDENMQPLRANFNVSRRIIIHERFREVLSQPLHIAGKSYSFLGFSHSSLRSHQVWFMAPFVYEGYLWHAKDVIRQLGNFNHIQTPAKCAARIGQAFTDISHSITIPPTCVKKITDVERNNRCFTDGCGTISSNLLAKVWKDFSRTGHAHATVLQIRFQGAKGMVSLDPSLEGEQLCLRPSMIKFEGSPSSELEVCGAGYSPRLCYLNRQFIKIFEDLGVESNAFVKLQNDALADLRHITGSPENASRFLEVNNVGSAARVHSLVTYLYDQGINYRDDGFLRKVVDVATLTQVRDLKYRARIAVPNGLTLLGVADETGTLAENEVYIATLDKKGRRSVYEGEVIITRAPALHPGDIQLAQAIRSSSETLLSLHNCIVFSTRGNRDLPSKLSGGDLDGDLFNVIWDRSLWPKWTYPPADYPRVPPVDIGRPVTSDDIIAFFLLFMETDRLGQICNTHTQVADQKSSGTVDGSCIKLAELASTAVDFSKTGIPPDMNQFPKNYQRRFKPDFMANVPRLLTQGKLFELEAEEDDYDDMIEWDLETAMVLNGTQQEIIYYESTKTLGELYRNIDETEFLKTLDAAGPKPPSVSPVTSVMASVWDYVQREAIAMGWARHLQLARDIRDEYEDLLVSKAQWYSEDSRIPLSEVEVFAGVILGRYGGLPSKNVRESNITMKERWEESVRYIRNRIIRGDEEIVAVHQKDRRDASRVSDNLTLERAVACLNVAMEEKGRVVNGLGELQSFKYVAAAVCLKEIQDGYGRF